jgi:type I restriction enzyme M protein
MDQATHSKIVSFIWGIADDVLRDLFKRGKYANRKQKESAET